ncbi:hypothetical protein N9147_05330, partial [Akkermansiaceae bacterium]|nr:hypothetical protein [Akkermansiaceae bacterium]
MTDFFGSITLGSNQLSGRFDVSVEGDRMIFGLSDGTLFVDSNPDGKLLDGNEAGLRVLDVHGIFAFDPDNQGFVLSASGDVNVYGSDIELGGRVAVTWNTTEQDVINESFTVGTTSISVSATSGSAFLSGDDISLETDVASLFFDFSIGLSTSAQLGLAITINDESLVFSDSARTNVAVT